MFKKWEQQQKKAPYLNVAAVGGQETLAYRVDNKHENWGSSE